VGRQRRPAGPDRHRGHARLARLSLRAQHRPHGRRPDRRGHTAERIAAAVQRWPHRNREWSRFDPSGESGMKRLLFPSLGIIAALWAAIAVVRTLPGRAQTNPPSPPAVSTYNGTVAAVGLVEASTENIWVGTPLAGVVARVFVTAGQNVEIGQPLFELDLRQLRADLGVRQQAANVARARAQVAEARIAD